MTIQADVAAVAKHFGEDPVLLQAIVEAEGNILRAVQCSVPSCQTREQALEITCRTLNHQRRSYVANAKLTSDFLAYFAKVWAPRGVANDPHDLNANWLDNVRHLARIA